MSPTRMDKLETSSAKHGERLGLLENALVRMATIMQLQIWVSGLIGGAVILAIVGRLLKLI